MGGGGWAGGLEGQGDLRGVHPGEVRAQPAVRAALEVAREVPALLVWFQKRRFEHGYATACSRSGVGINSDVS